MGTGIHKFVMNNNYIVVDAASANFFSVDKLAYEMLDYFPEPGSQKAIEALRGEYGQAEAEEAASEIAQLIEGGKLFASDPYESGLFAAEEGLKPKALCLNISHDCNLSCKYCFASGGDFNLKKEYMPVDIAKASVLFLASNAEATNLEIDFFGGEPLMNYQTLKECVEYARSIEGSTGKKFRFTVTTNAYFLDEGKMAWLNNEMDNIVFSIDGRQEVHDNMRPTKEGHQSYERIAKNISDAVKARGDKSYYARATFTKSNLDFVADVESIASLGIANISAEPVVTSESNDFAITNADLGKIRLEYEKLAEYCIKRSEEGKAINFFHFAIDSENEICMKKRFSGCGSGVEYLAVAPSGDIYPCHQFVGNEAFLMGNVHEGLSKSGEGIRKTFLGLNAGTKEECKNCWAKYFCGGGCASNSLNFGTGINGVYEIGCEMLKKRLECALYIKTAENS